MGKRLQNCKRKSFSKMRYVDFLERLGGGLFRFSFTFSGSSVGSTPMKRYSALV